MYLYTIKLSDSLIVVLPKDLKRRISLEIKEILQQSGIENANVQVDFIHDDLSREEEEPLLKTDSNYLEA